MNFLARTDILTIHILCPWQRTLYRKWDPAKMKPTVILIHAVRGGVMDDAVFIEALKRGTLAATGLDVFENGLVLNPEFLQWKNAMLTPPIASSIEATRHTMTLTTALAGKPSHQLNS